MMETMAVKGRMVVCAETDPAEMLANADILTAW
jgi:hypothetical protein